VLSAAHASRRLCDVPSGGLDDLARVAGDVAASLAALEARGIVHGDVHAGHVLVDETGSARLCGFAAGGRLDDGFDPTTDAQALGHLILDGLQRLGPSVDTEPRQWLRALANRAVTGELSATDIAAELRARPRAAPQRVLGGLSRAGHVKIRPERRAMVWVAGAAVGVLAVVAAAMLSSGARRGHDDGYRANAVTPGARTSAAAPEFTYLDGVLTTDDGRWAIGNAGDLVAIGDWDCDGTPTAVLVDAPSGAAYEFDRWAASDADVAAHPLGTVTGATSVRATDANGDDCDDVVVERADAEPVVLRPSDD